jgi:hypothetical protein
VATKVALGNGRSGWSTRRRSVVEEEDGMLERRSSPRRSASCRGLGHREAVMRVHEGSARWPTFGAEANGERQSGVGRELDDNCEGEEGNWLLPR